MTWPPGAVGHGAGARWGRSGPRPQDVLLALGCALLALVSLTGRISPLGETDQDWLAHFRGADALGIGLVLLASAGLLLLRWRALLSLALVDTCMFVLHAVGYVPPPLPATELVVLYAIATTRRLVVSALATSVTALSIVVADLMHDVSLDDDKLVAYLLAVVMAWTVGYVVQVSRAQTRIAEENVRLLAEQQEVRTQIAVREEKERLSRELHDIVAHGVGVMVALAAAGRLAPRDGAVDAAHALAAIESTGRTALGEMRALMRDLHGTDESPPMLSDGALAALVEETRIAGLEVDLTVEGEPRELPAGVDQAAFRVVQESLTNTLRHSGAARVRVTIGYRPEAVDVRVSDDGNGRLLPRRRVGDMTPGHGHLGMQRRVGLLGGAFRAGPTGSGFEVVATIPLGQDR